jgi:hypothetical protein
MIATFSQVRVVVATVKYFLIIRGTTLRLGTNLFLEFFVHIVHF